MIVYFSGTGNSRYCAEMLAKELEDTITDSFAFIRQKNGARLSSEKPWVFVCPTYAWRIPRIFREFIEKSEFCGNTSAYFVMTCGSEIGTPEVELGGLCSEKGLSYKGVLEVKMPENYLAMFKVPSQEECDRIIDAAAPLLLKAAESIKDDLQLPSSAKGLLDKVKTRVVNPVFYKCFVNSKGFYVKNSCTGCGKCALVCPLQNIELSGSRPVWHENCTHCMACICRCPAEAIEYKKNSIGQTRYMCREFKEEDL